MVGRLDEPGDRGSGVVSPQRRPMRSALEGDVSAAIHLAFHSQFRPSEILSSPNRL
jgi:hypothetical protein